MLFAKVARVLSLLALPFALAVNAHASVVTFDFEDLNIYDNPHFSNYYSQGFRFSPNCHYDTGAGLTGKALIWDQSGCEPNNIQPFGNLQSNPDWLGPPELSPNTNPDAFVSGYWREGSWMYIDRYGADFSLFETDLAPYVDYMTILSSKGGTVNVTPWDPPHVSFHGAQWRNVTWLLISGGGGQPFGIDNLVAQFAVPEPATLALAGVALMGVGVTRRRRIHFL